MADSATSSAGSQSSTSTTAPTPSTSGSGPTQTTQSTQSSNSISVSLSSTDSVPPAYSPTELQSTSAPSASMSPGPPSGRTTTTSNTALGALPSRTDSEAAKHGAHSSTAAIGSAIGGAILFLALLASFVLFRKRLKRYRARTQNHTALGDHQRPESVSAGTATSSVQRMIGNSAQRPGTPWEAPAEWATVHPGAPPQDVVGKPLEDKLLLRHSIASLALVGSRMHSPCSVGDGVEGRSDAHPAPPNADDERFTARSLASRVVRDSWGSDGDSEDPGQAMTETSSSTGWHPSRMVRPPSSSVTPVQEEDSASSELARRGDRASYTFEWEETGMAL
ncbi:hypothetical protein GY45DRAFT_1331164 [Cubamyces sp. BRFM 1775]|nr:hypothetical protein GY45DRAFT_1331164 [Cubamyces sp. BRFM 1775]